MENANITEDKNPSKSGSNSDKNYSKFQQMNRKISEVEALNSKNAHSSLIETPENMGLMFKSFKMESTKSNKNKIVDPLHGINVWESWKRRNKEKIKGINNINSGIILRFLSDLEKGINTGKRSKKGKRSPRRLSSLSYHIVKIARHFEKLYGKNLAITKDDPKSCLTRKEVHDFFDDLKSGIITQKNGEPYKSAGDFTKDFICYWNWYMRIIDEENEESDRKNEEIEKKNKNLLPKKQKPKLEKTFLPDLVKYLSRGDFMDSNSFVYFTHNELKQVLPHINESDRTLALFLFDSIARSPIELANIYVNDLSFKDGEVWVYIRKEISKTYERKFNLILCGEQIKDHIMKNKLNPEDRLFPDYRHRKFNKNLQKAFIKVFGNVLTKGGKPFSEITGYSFRHSGCCYLRSKKINMDTLRVRGGWKTFKRIDYYTKFLGLDGRITKDMLSEQPSVNESLMRLVEKQNQELAKMREKMATLLSERVASGIEVKNYA